MRTAQLRRGLWIALLVTAIAAVLAWWLSRPRLPARLVIATGEPGGLYHRLAEALAERIQARDGITVEVLATRGSLENLQLLESGAADLALTQGGLANAEPCVTVAPLYEELFHVVVRRGSNAKTLHDLAGCTVAIGPAGSGMAQSAKTLLSHYDLGLHTVGKYFRELASDDTIDAAIVVTGPLNPDLRGLLAGGDYRVVPIEEAAALILHHPHLHTTTIPKGLYVGHPALPPSDLATVGTTSYVTARHDTSRLVVTKVLEALYDGGVADAVPTLADKSRAAKMRVIRWHPAAQAYYDPYAGLDVLSNLMESLSATKELLFALVAGAYLIRKRWQSIQQAERQRELDRLKEHLDTLLAQTVTIEEAQMDERDIDRLEEYLDNITAIKIRALRELTHEDLRGDRMFQIFLSQCSNLIRKIQSKISTETQRLRQK